MEQGLNARLKVYRFGCPGSAMSGYAREKSILSKTAKNESLTIYICSVENIEENPIKLPDSPY